jgi:hypothetical protein
MALGIGHRLAVSLPGRADQAMTSSGSKKSAFSASGSSAQRWMPRDGSATGPNSSLTSAHRVMLRSSASWALALRADSGPPGRAGSRRPCHQRRTSARLSARTGR